MAVEISVVVVGGKLALASSYAHLLPGQRPESFCPECGKRVILKLGDERVHHAAHMRSEDAQRCSLASCPERIEHWRSKYYLAKILRSRSSLSFSEPCSRRSCRNRWIQVVIEGWDEVDVEIMVGRQRPDIVLLKNGEPIFAIEVFVTHAVDEEKKRDLDEFGIRWIEVNGKRSLYEGTAAWKGISPLTGRYSELSALWVCGACEEAERLRRKQDKEKKEKRERERRRNARQRKTSERDCEDRRRKKRGRGGSPGTKRH